MLRFNRCNDELMVLCDKAMVGVVLYEYNAKPIAVGMNYILYPYYNGIEQDIKKAVK